jgi:carnitine O-acetyltransferase
MPQSQQQRNRTSSATEANSSPKPLYASQHLLPHLPVPSLNSTFHKYLETLQPHLDSASFDRNSSHIKNFLQSPLSSTLQARLEARASEKESWLSEWWNEAAYMSYRDSIVPNVNYFYLHRKGLGKGASQARRAAEIVRATRVFRDLVTTEKLEPESIKSKPLDASAYPALFNASRIPTKPSDTFEIYPAAPNEHVIVLRKDRLWKVGTKGLAVGDLEGAFQQVIKAADQSGASDGVGIGTLTGEDRDVWTEARDHLVSLSPVNAEILKSIQSSIVVINLDDTLPAEGRDGRSWNLYTGDGKAGRNRWFDKHEFVVDPNGESGFNGERESFAGFHWTSRLPLLPRL